jgi:hypothetical protein
MSSAGVVSSPKAPEATGGEREHEDIMRVCDEGNDDLGGVIELKKCQLLRHVLIN